MVQKAEDFTIEPTLARVGQMMRGEGRNDRVEWTGVRDGMCPVRVGVIGNDKLHASFVHGEPLASAGEHGLGDIDENAPRLWVIVKDGAGEHAIAATKIEKALQAIAARRGEKSQHHIDLLDGERDRAADVLEEFRGEVWILPEGGLIGHGKGRWKNCASLGWLFPKSKEGQGANPVPR